MTRPKHKSSIFGLFSKLEFNCKWIFHVFPPKWNLVTTRRHWTLIYEVQTRLNELPCLQIQFNGGLKYEWSSFVNSDKCLLGLRKLHQRGKGNRTSGSSLVSELVLGENRVFYLWSSHFDAEFCNLCCRRSIQDRIQKIDSCHACFFFTRDVPASDPVVVHIATKIQDT